MDSSLRAIARPSRNLFSINSWHVGLPELISCLIILRGEISMESYQTKITVNSREILTLKDILPEDPGLKILFIAKTPAPISVNAGHYFQGSQGTAFWNKLKNYGILKASPGVKEDTQLISHGYGILDIVKTPRGYGNEPSDEEYKDGMDRILNVISIHNPSVIVFVYKKPLDKILKSIYSIEKKSAYGFNHDLKELFGSHVFVFPMPGTPCTTKDAHKAMTELSMIYGR